VSSTSPDDEARTADPARVVDVLPSAAPRSDVLVLGPTLSDKDRLAFDLVIAAWQDGGVPFVVSATEAAREFRSRFDGVLPAELSAAAAYVIDCTEATTADDTTDDLTCRAASPADLTGVSICLSKALERFEPTDGRRILLDNIATLLIYSEFDRVYQFISAINRRADDANLGTVHLLDTDAIEATDRRKLFQLFPTVVQVRQNGERPLFRVRGRSESPWYEYRPMGGDR
jgi:hypothetical protein